MITKTLLGKVTALTVLPAMTLGLFAAPALAMGMPGDLTLINVQNDNEALVINAFDVEANSGRNAVVGGDGGNARIEADPPRRGDVEAYGGDGARGGTILTGDAMATLLISNETNTADTRINIDDCGECDKYNEFYLSADRYYEEWSASERHMEECSFCPPRHRELTESEESYEESSGNLEVYAKMYVPEMTIVNVENDNEAAVINLGRVEANTGENAAVGGDGGRAVIEEPEGFLDLAVPVQSFKFPMHHPRRGGSDIEAYGGDGAPGGLIATGEADALVQVVDVTNRTVTRITR